MKEKIEEQTIYSKVHPRGFGHILLHESCDDKARQGPVFIELLKERGGIFLKHLFNAVSDLRTAPEMNNREPDNPDRNFIMVINEGTLLKDKYFHTHYFQGAADPQNDNPHLQRAEKPEFQYVVDDMTYSKSGQSENLKESLIKLKKSGDGTEQNHFISKAVYNSHVCVFDVDESIALSSNHRVIVVRDQTLEDIADNDKVCQDIKDAFIDSVDAGYEQRGLRFVIDTFNNPDYAVNTDNSGRGLVIHIIDDFEPDKVQDSDGATRDHRWFEPHPFKM